ncbi:hypothetical protein dsx2_1363 [Desulfovibrio sp. X2]|uniref:hypothetical protein n=1 Tax=Desulfovibrio sp. X2 TaxID=941449 RepID=UPI0003586D71|nr:hypothetical protein [Desulfovibrio sp. X2]EPR44735.1 hypothetical protein dsx2_1363 [Desulfovibrio sp. X2]
MDKERQLALQVAKEIVVKFIEVQRISPANFTDHFAPIYREVLRTLTASAPIGSLGSVADEADDADGKDA